MKTKKLKKQPNIVLIISDQQTWIQNWDQDWAKKELPAMQKLMANGLTFNRAHCNTCTCSPSRATLFSSTYPAFHKITEVLGFDKPSSQQQISQNIFNSNYQSIFKMMEDAGYHVEYKGKWHLTKPTVYLNNEDDKKIDTVQPVNHLYWTKADPKHLANHWGINGWNYPDAGDDMALYNFGGGDVNNDGRFITGRGQSAMYGKKLPGKTVKQSLIEKRKDSVVEFINTYKKKYKDKPLFLVVSLVNPHDVLAYPNLYQEGGYKDKDFENIKVKLPVSIDEDLSTKPFAQTAFKALSNAGNGLINTKKKARKYIQFYAYLTSVVDKEINKVLIALKKNRLTDNTLIVRVSDHGDMSMSHNMQRQKMYNVYRQTLNVPMIFSNPIMFPKPKTTNSLSGLIDVMPTLATIAKADKRKFKFQGKDLTPILKNPKKEVQEYVHFTYDDTYLTLPNPASMGPCHIRCIVSKEWKYAVYFDPNYGQKAQYEMYNLKKDKAEMKNLAWKKGMGGKMRQFLHRKLTEMMIELGTMPDAIIWPKISGDDVFATQPIPGKDT